MMILENKYKVFLVDKNVFIRNKLMELLPEIGIEIVGMASRSREAFQFIAETRPNVVLLDTFLRDLPSEDVIRGILAINPNITIILMCPLSNLREVMYLMQRGASDFIPKPLIDAQVEYVMRKYEFSQGIRPVSKIKSIAQLLSIFFNEIIEHSPRNIRKHIQRAVEKPMKRLNREYKDRYFIHFSPIRIELLLDTKGEDKIYHKYYNQLNRLYLSIMNNLNKELPDEYVYSLLMETYQSFYSVAKHLIEGTNYSFPVWKNFYLQFDDNQNKTLDETRVDYTYLTDYPYIAEEMFLHDEEINEKLRPYLFIVTHDPRLAPKFPKNRGLKLDDIDLHLVLSYFDDILGPVVSSITPPPHGKLEGDRLNSIPRLLDTIGAEPGKPFIHAAESLGSVNIIFPVELPVRGGTRDYMLSVVVTPVEVRAMVKINQMNSILRATTSLLKNYYEENPQSIENSRSIYVSNEANEILKELYEETHQYLIK